MKIALALTVLIVAVAGGVTVAADGHTAATQLSFPTHQHDLTEVDVGKKGTSIGDSFIFSERLVASGKQVGFDHVVCVHAAVWPRDAESCTGTVVLGSSTLTLAGDAGRGPFTLAVVGGTGAYADARGSARITSHGASGTLTISLV